MNTPHGKTTVVGSNPYIVLNNQGQMSPRFQLKGNYHVLGRNPQQADLVIPASWEVVSNCQAIIKKINNNYYIYDGDGNKPSTNGLFVNYTRITPKDGILLTNGIEIKIGQNPKNLVLLTYFDLNSLSTQQSPKQKSVSLANQSVVLGRDFSATLQLDAPTVSRRHAVIQKNNSGQYVLKDYSTNGVFINGQKVNGTAILLPNSSIRIGPYTLIRRGDNLVLADSGNSIRLDAHKIIRIVKDKHQKEVRLLSDISLPIEPGQFIALVGGSGAGKSTLMRTLLGIDPTTKGTVYLNGENLRNNFNIYRTQIGYVPQTDIVHKELRVSEVLTYAAKLRLPPDTDVNQVVEKTLQQIEMLDRRDVLVSELSGGQLKRVSIGVELLADPKLFFLDEPTSGLDPGLDKKMMQLLRKLADEGRTIVLVTHATSNINECDRIAFLGFGGYLCYFGPPKEAINFFQIPSQGDFADIYIKLEDKSNVPKAATKYYQSDYRKRYVDSHLSQGNSSSKKQLPQQVKRSPLDQLFLLTQRNFQLALRDKVNLLLSLITAPLGIALITLAIRDQDPLVLGSEPNPSLAPLALRVLFVFTSAAIWVGLSSSLQEIIKEAAIYTRERLVNLGLFAYLGSKAIVLSGLAALQTLLMVIVILLGFKSPDPETLPWVLGLTITTFLTLFTSMSLGLMVSAGVKNGSQANSALPLLLIPQIIFSGVLFKMEGIGQYISWFMLSRWSVGAYGSLVDVNHLVPEPEPYVTIPQPFEPTPIYDPTLSNIGLNWGLLILHTMIYLGITFWIQKRKDIF